MILIATTMRDGPIAGFTADVVKLCRAYPDSHYFEAIGIYIATLRQMCVTAARTSGASHLLFIDADMRFPDSSIARLLGHDREIVAANYKQRTMPIWWTAKRDGEWISSEGRSGLEAVDYCGCGLMLIKLSLFDRLTRPWFDTPYDEARGSQQGEDVYFCEKARAAGAEIWIDHDLSKFVRHQGTIEHGVSIPAPPLVAVSV